MDRVSARVMVVSGGIVSAIGFLAGSFAQSLDVVIMCFGLLSGDISKQLFFPLNIIMLQSFQLCVEILYFLNGDFNYVSIANYSLTPHFRGSDGNDGGPLTDNA